MAEVCAHTPPASASLTPDPVPGTLRGAAGAMGDWPSRLSDMARREGGRGRRGRRDQGRCGATPHAALVRGRRRWAAAEAAAEEARRSISWISLLSAPGGQRVVCLRGRGRRRGACCAYARTSY